MSFKQFRTTTLVLGVALGGLGFAGCAHKVALQTAPGVPAAEGNLKVSKGDAGNTKLDVEVKHLAEPERVAPGASTYVVWIQPPQGNVQNVGALQVDDDKSGELETVTPHEDFQVFITAEPTPTVTSPSNQRLMFANVNQ